MRIASPGNAAMRAVDGPIALRAAVTCPAGVVGEAQFWVKPNGARTWTVLSGYATGDASWEPTKDGAWNVTAVAHAVGSSPSHDVRAPAITFVVPPHGSPTARNDSLTAKMSTPTTLNILSNDDDPDGDSLVVTGFTQGAHGKVVITGTTATYTPTPGFAGQDCFKYTVSDGHGHTSTATVAVTVQAATPTCTITISGPATAVKGPPIHLTANASCDIGTPEIRWQHRTSTTSFTTFKTFSTATIADFVTTSAPLGQHFFVAQVRSQGTTTRFTSNTVTTNLIAAVAPCTAVALDTPTAGAVFASSQAIALHATATCPTGVTPEYQYRSRAPGAETWTVLTGFVSGSASFTPPQAGAWALSVVARGVGSQVAFDVQSPDVAVMVDDAPQANDDALAIDEDTTGTVNVLANDVDANGDTLTATITVGPEAGTATIASGVVTYTPAANFHGNDSLTYTVDDGHGNTASATLHIAISPVNDAPVGVDDTLVALEDTALSIDVTLNDQDIDGDALTITAITAPEHGTATFAGTVVTYAPGPDYNGPDIVHYTVSDGHGGTAIAAVVIQVLAVNDAPIAVDDDLTTAEDTDGGVYLVGNDRDPDGETPTVTSFTQPEHGSVAVVDGFASYHPVHDYNGPDAFTYTIADAAGTPSIATVHITVLPVNDPPSATNDSAALDEDASVTIDAAANDTDVDGDTLAIASITQPAHGTAVIVSGHEILYTPAPDFFGSDALTYTIGDPSGAQATATVALAIANVNDAPVAADDAATTNEDTAATIDVVANDRDADGDDLAVTAVAPPAHGTLEIADAHHVIYTPVRDYNGPDSFGYTISDGHGGTTSATVAITVLPVNDAPVARADSATLLEDASVTIDVVANDSDVDGDPLAITAMSAPTAGSVVVLDARHILYTPAPNFHGIDAFTYTVGDPFGAMATAVVALEVVSVNDAPIASADSAVLDEDTAATVDVVANDFDVDGDDLAIASITQPSHGLALALDAHHVRYVPAPDFHGNDALSYTIDDGHGGQATAALTLVVNSVNDAPVAADDAATLAEDAQVTIDVVANDADVDVDALAVAALTQPAHGAAVIVDLTHVRYTPAANFNGADAFSYTVDDGHGGQAIATVALTVTPVNDPPVAADDAATLDEDTSAVIDVVANDSDIDGDALTVVAVTPPANGTAAIADARHVRYTPNANFHGSDAFSYTVNDPSGAQATANVAVTVNSVNDAPVASAVSVSTFDDTRVVVALAASDVDGDALAFSIASSPAHGTLGPVTGNRVAYTPAAGFVGNDTFTFTASDGTASSATAAVTVTVVRSVCGNGVREGVHEECDDGNQVPSDGCESSCRLTCGSGTGADRSTVDAASGHCFAAYDGVQNSYQQAATMCAGFGGHLPTIGSEGEDDAAFAAVHAGDSPWLGADDIAAESTFRWTTGEPFGFSNFASGKPDNAGNADCVRYAPDGTWTDAPCSGGPSVTGTLCELELAVATPAFATGGAGTRGVAIADLNGDGYPDIAATNQTANTVGVLLGNGAGGYALGATYTGFNGPTAVATGDFDGDGRADVAVVNAGNNTLTVLHQTASGTLTTAATIGIAAGATALAVADLNGDGKLDIAVAASGTVQLLRGDGTGALSVLGSVLITGAAASIAAGDFDHDGRVDLAVATPLAILVVASNGVGTFGLPVTLALSTNNRSVIATDLDGDGNLDLAVANGAANISVFFGNALGVFLTPVTLTVATTPQVVAAGDFDGDGTTDLVAVTGSFATLFHRAGRTFTQSGSPIAIGGGATFAAAANLNGDAATDLVVASPTTSSAAVVLGGSSGLSGARALPIGTGDGSTVSADFNGDGLADLAVVDPSASKVYVFLQTSGGALVQSATINTPSGGGATYAVAADFNGDTRLDLAIVNVTFSSVTIATGTGTGTFNTPTNVGTGQTPGRPAVGDFSGDGRPDLAIPAAGSTSGNKITLLINTGLGFGSSDLPVANAPSAVAIADFNGDHKQDLAIATTGEASIKVALGHGDNTFGTPAAFAIPSGSQSVAAADLDGDGKADIAATTTGGVSLLHGNGTGGFAAATTIATGASPSAVIAVDLDGDTRTDLVVANAGAGSLSILHNDGLGGFVAFVVAVGAAPAWVMAADLDHDGHLDLTAASGNPFVTMLMSAR